MTIQLNPIKDTTTSTTYSTTYSTTGSTTTEEEVILTAKETTDKPMPTKKPKPTNPSATRPVTPGQNKVEEDDEDDVQTRFVIL